MQPLAKQMVDAANPFDDFISFRMLSSGWTVVQSNFISSCFIYYITFYCLSFSLCLLCEFSVLAAKRKMWKLKSFGSLRNVSKTGNVDRPRCPFQQLSTGDCVAAFVIFLWEGHWFLTNMFLENILIVSFFLICGRWGQFWLPHRIEHRPDLALWSPECGGEGFLGPSHRESDPGQPAAVWEQQKQGRKEQTAYIVNTLTVIKQWCHLYIYV